MPSERGPKMSTFWSMNCIISGCSTRLLIKMHVLMYFLIFFFYIAGQKEWEKAIIRAIQCFSNLVQLQAFYILQLWMFCAWISWLDRVCVHKTIWSLLLLFAIKSSKESFHSGSLIWLLQFSYESNTLCEPRPTAASVALCLAGREKKETKLGATNNPACLFTALFPEAIRSALKAAEILPNSIYLSWCYKLVWNRFTSRQKMHESSIEMKT